MGAGRGGGLIPGNMGPPQEASEQGSDMIGSILGRFFWQHSTGWVGRAVWRSVSRICAWKTLISEPPYPSPALQHPRQFEKQVGAGSFFFPHNPFLGVKICENFPWENVSHKRACRGVAVSNDSTFKTG